MHFPSEDLSCVGRPVPLDSPMPVARFVFPAAEEQGKLLRAFLGCTCVLWAHLEKRKQRGPQGGQGGLPRDPIVFSKALSPAHPPTSTGPTNFSLLLAQPSADFTRRLALSYQLKYLFHSQKPGSRKERSQSCQGRAGLADLAMYPILYQYPGKGEKPFG